MNNTPYTPNTAEVCGWYVQAMQDNYTGMEADEAEDAFYRWLDSLTQKGRASAD